MVLLQVLVAAVAGTLADDDQTFVSRPTTTDGTVCDITDPKFGAVGDNGTEATSAIQKAIDTCAAVYSQRSTNDNNHSRTVIKVPSGGRFLTRPLQLRSGVELHIEANASLIAWSEWQTWPNSSHAMCHATPYESKHPIFVPVRESLVWGENLSNVAITGDGTIDGQGWRWWPLYAKDKQNEYWHNCRPKLLRLDDSSDVVLSGVTLRDSPMYHVSFSHMVNLDIEGVTVDSGCGFNLAPNTDGFNVHGNNIRIHNCSVRNGDDCVPLNAPSSNVTVTNLRCECGNGVVPIVWGKGGEISNVLFQDIELINTHTGIAVKSLPSYNGTVKNVVWDRVTMHGVDEGIFVNVFGQSIDANHPTVSVFVVSDSNDLSSPLFCFPFLTVR